MIHAGRRAGVAAEGFKRAETVVMLMKIQVISKTDREVEFILDESNPQFANALRRVMMSEIPVAAVDSVEFYGNDSALYDEVVSHRLGMMPLKFDPKSFKGDDNIVLVIDKKGPGMVYSKDIKSQDAVVVSPLYEDVPIVELAEGQKIKAEATVRLGVGKEHAKWQAARVWYRYYPVIDQKSKVSNGNDVEKACHNNAVKVNDGKVEVSHECDLSCHADKVAEPKDAFTLKGSDRKFVFNVESISGLTAEQVIIIASDILRGKAKEFGKEVAAL